MGPNFRFFLVRGHPFNGVSIFSIFVVKTIFRLTSDSIESVACGGVPWFRCFFLRSRVPFSVH